MIGLLLLIAAVGAAGSVGFPAPTSRWALLIGLWAAVALGAIAVQAIASRASAERELWQRRRDARRRNGQVRWR